MPKMRALKEAFYRSRMLRVGDEFDPMPGDVAHFMKRGRAELVPDEPKSRARKAEPEEDPQTAEPEVPEPTHAELMDRANELGVELPSGYVRKDDLAAMIDAAERQAEISDDEI